MKSSSVLLNRNPIFIKIKLLLVSVIFFILFFLFVLVTKKFYLREELLYVVKVIDGDTFIDENGRKIRLIGVDAPEIGEKCYEESKNRLKELIEKKYVKINKDIKENDKYGRLLAYVFINETNVNLLIVREGYAYVFTDNINTKLLKELYFAEKHARENNIGCLWKN